MKKKETKKKSMKMTVAKKKISLIIKKCISCECSDMMINKEEKATCDNCRLVKKSIEEFGYNVLAPDYN